MAVLCRERFGSPGEAREALGVYALQYFVIDSSQLNAHQTFSTFAAWS